MRIAHEEVAREELALAAIDAVAEFRDAAPWVGTLAEANAKVRAEAETRALRSRNAARADRAALLDQGRLAAEQRAKDAERRCRKIKEAEEAERTRREIVAQEVIGIARRRGWRKVLVTDLVDGMVQGLLPELCRKVGGLPQDAQAVFDGVRREVAASCDLAVFDAGRRDAHIRWHEGGWVAEPMYSERVRDAEMKVLPRSVFVNVGSRGWLVGIGDDGVPIFSEHREMAMSIPREQFERVAAIANGVAWTRLRSSDLAGCERSPW